MSQKSLFIALEGLDGSGKTSVARYMASVFNTAGQAKVKLTYEPHDPSCGGLYIRQVLMKKITDFSPKVLALAFAANRLDHCAREIDPWLNGGDGRLLLCDRYYLSSLVYQSSDDMDFEDVYKLNDAAIKPDLIFFLNVSNEVCYKRMQHRNQARELFETNLSQTREKFHRAMDFLRDEKDEKIIEVDASGSVPEVADAILSEVYKINPGLKPEQSTSSPDAEIGKVARSMATLTNDLSYCIEDAVTDLSVFKRLKNENTEEGATTGPKTKKASLADMESEEKILDQIETGIQKLSLDRLTGLFLDFICKHNYSIEGKVPATELDAYQVIYELPAGILLRGVALIIPEEQRYDDILKLAPDIPKMSDFMFVYSPGPSKLVIDYYERALIKFETNPIQEGIFPSVTIVTQRDLAESIMNSAKGMERNMQS